MNFPSVSYSQWRALVEKELAGKNFDKVLVDQTAEGIPVSPLYTEAPAAERLSRSVAPSPFRICMRHGAGSTAAELDADVSGGADALWLDLGAMSDEALARPELGRCFLVLDGGKLSATEAVRRATTQLPSGARSSFALNFDPIAARARGTASHASLEQDLAELGRAAALVEDKAPGATAGMVSTLPWHDAGADAADELAYALSTGARYLEALLQAGLTPDQAARQLAVQVAVGRDTFLELCKVRALRTVWSMLLTGAGAGEASASRTRVHAVCSSRTLTVRDPWVNMLRSTTQMFSAILGGADLVTPSAFDQVLGAPSALGRRVARNTGLILREESMLGKVIDPAGGAYFFETLTDQLAREAWKRFQKLEAEGGVVAGLQSGAIASRLETAWKEREERIAKRKVPVLGVSEFANLDEKLPGPVPEAGVGIAAPGGLPVHRDAEDFEVLRARADKAATRPEVVLVTLGTLADSRPRAGFASNFFASGGLRIRETTKDEKARIACLCGTDEQYAAEAVTRARALKAAGCTRVLVAGRPGALEASLREAGVDGFIFLGCDAVGMLSELLGLFS